MMLLTTTTSILELKTGGASKIDWTASWVDMTSSAFTPDASDGTVSSATSTTLIAAPAASTQRQVKFISLRNVGASSNVVTIQKDVSGTDREILVMTLLSGEALHYTDGQGWVAFDANGNRKQSVIQILPVPAAQMSPIFATANLTSVKTITSTNTFALYMGKAPRALTSVQMRLRVTTAVATITWAEVALAKGAPVVAGNPTLTTVGFLDVSASHNSTGQKTHTLTVASGQQVAEGDDLWLLIGCNATTATVVRAQSIADDLQSGFQGSAVMRPSLNVGTGVVFTIEGATALAAWLAIIY
jgi:hypothetical protein